MHFLLEREWVDRAEIRLGRRERRAVVEDEAGSGGETFNLEREVEIGSAGLE